MPVAELAAQLEPDVRVLVDAAHAPGMIDFDVARLGASYVTANCHKWMCSAKGAAFLWVRPDRRDDVYPAVISHGYNGGWPSAGGHLHAQFDWTGTHDPSAWLTIPDALAAGGGDAPLTAGPACGARSESCACGGATCSSRLSASSRQHLRT